MGAKIKCAPALSRMLTEVDLISEFHWLPQDIAKIPYKKMQMILFILKQKADALESRRVIERAKSEVKSRVGGKRSIREV